MSADRGDKKPKAPVPVKPKPGPAAKPAPAGKAPPPKKPGPVGRPPPPVPYGPSDFEVTAPGAQRLPSLADLRRITGTSAPSLAPVAQKPPERRLETPFTSAQPGLVRPPTIYQKQLQSSGFDDDERTNTDVMMGNVAAPQFDEDEEEVTVTTPIYDGVSAPEELTSLDTWKATTAPVQSKFGRRSASTYGRVIDQFAVGNNPRYEPDAQGRSRMHIFVWDVTRAMNCEVPHFLGGRELSLGQTVDWLRFDSNNRGWKRANAAQAAQAADRGEAALALPRDGKVKLLAVARPGGLDGEGFPRVAAAIAEFGNDLSAVEALQTSLIDYLVHD